MTDTTPAPASSVAASDEKSHSLYHDEHRDANEDPEEYRGPKGVFRRLGNKRAWRRFAVVEWTSIDPVPEEEQVQRSFLSVAFIWFSANVNGTSPS